MLDLARLRQRWPVLDHLLTIQKRFGAVGGGPLASSIGLAGFLSLFPLLLVGIAVVGFLSSGNSDLADDLVRELGLEGQAADLVTNSVSTAEGSRRAASIVGLAGLLWAGLGVVGALQAAVNTAWQTTGRGVHDKLVALGWLVGAGLLFLGTLGAAPLLRVLPGPVALAASVLSVTVTTGILLWAYDFLGNQPVPRRAHLVGAVVVAVGFEVLKLIGTVYVPRLVQSSSALYGAIGVVFTLLAYLLLYARLFVYGAVINVHRWQDEVGTVTVEIDVPRFEGEVPMTAGPGGAVEEVRGPS